MIKRLFCLVILLSGSFLLFSPASYGADIASVRARTLDGESPVSGADVKVISSYLKGAFEEMLYAASIDDAVAARSELVSYGGTCRPSQYSLAFNGELKKQLPGVLSDIESSFDDSAKVTFLRTSLLVITSELCSTEFVDFATGMLGDKKITIRYWAVKTLCNQGIVDYLNAGVAIDKAAASRVFSTLEKISASEREPSIQDLLILFAGQVKSADSIKILENIADIRIAAYEDWSVSHEMTDSKLLLAIGRKLIKAKASRQKSRLAPKFGQLFSYVSQRYVLGKGYLPEESIASLEMILREVDNQILYKLLNGWLRPIKTAIDRRKRSTLPGLFKKVFGGSGGKGQLARDLKFSYTDADGKSSGVPRQLREPESEED